PENPADEPVDEPEELADEPADEPETPADELASEEAAEPVVDTEDQADQPVYRADDDEDDDSALDELEDLIDFLLDFFDGIEYWAKARKIAKNAEQGFDILVTPDGSSWEKVVGDGLNDPYNYGARTFTRFNDELYVGTANPYFGAQLWKVTGEGTEPEDVTPPPTGDPYDAMKWIFVLLGSTAVLVPTVRVTYRRRKTFSE
ncbi:MAG: hypothetical protein IKT11_00535, partial [Bacteroidales bacterium]|nr:hypothetical protein [Bacteroidales bacterium]